uniref:PCI domain-containing protein n=1 Tax=Chromera velia CCMP2878 TaxID=1169474 RepID=A0A0G4FTB7_9ALVE|eukprot:Cvel_18572.t1-p1 / transcript=Cvel_18572.t1 / gene=Cvel_18572 / organism=Chromera_velia_CCMP2878 / gene_product=26S proteasome non-ATPase regulatory subunit 11, putative / transcript_product=26S proteasome non-ATPase regulatory subunit 11, putative / location=Cvel_scaffold1548:15919-20992(-) / protein_length=441 / sequence_SO=supercontig / SO=protein_coding / is_pseudo=false
MRAEAELRGILNSDSTDDTGEDVKVQEQSIYALGQLFVQEGNTQGLKNLMTEIRPFFTKLPKARTAKIVRSIIDMAEKIPDSVGLQMELCKDCIEWCKQEKRTFLRLRVETKLAALLLQDKKFQQALSLLSELQREVKKLDDKLLLVEIHLVEAKTNFALQNIPKAKAALTAARTNANSIHCPPLLQAEIDMLNGALNAQERDYKTAFSYFYEAFEALNLHAHDPKEHLVAGAGAATGVELDGTPTGGARATAAKKSEREQGSEKALSAFKYMLLAKIMCGQSDEVPSLTSGKQGIKFQGPDVEALKAIAKCCKQRSLKQFEATLQQYKTELLDDGVIKHHTEKLYDDLLEQNIVRILEPYSRVEIQQVAKMMDLPLDKTLAKLGEMILDKKINGTLDQGIGVLILYDDTIVRDTYGDAVATIQNMATVVDSLYEKATKLA